MPAPVRPSVARCLGLTLVVALMGGCDTGGKPTGRLDGQVLYKGQPVTDGEVQLYLKDRGIGAGAALDGAGRFSIPSLETGTYAVAVTPPQPKEAAGGGPANIYRNIPAKARDLSTSGLTVTVKKGNNSAEFDLRD